MRHFTRKAVTISMLIAGSALFAATAASAQTCGQPASDGTKPVVRDCIQIARASLGAADCRDCVCDTNGSGDVSLTDALRCLWFVVGADVTLDCPTCDSSTTTTEQACASCSDVFFHVGEQEDLCESSQLLYDAMIECPCTDCSEICAGICQTDTATTLERGCPRCIYENCRDAVAACVED
jgi:hypothetical protein